MRTAFSRSMADHRGCQQLLVLLLCLSGVTACRSPGSAGALLGDPIVDTKGVNAAAYQGDLVECRQYAEQVGVVARSAGGAAAGAAVGAAVGAVLDGKDGAGRGAGVGAVTGGVRGVAHGLRERRQVLRNCLQGRGYRVLN